MVRLYTESDLAVGMSISLDPSEQRYLKVRRRASDVELFNRKGLRARGEIEGNRFLVTSVETARFESLPIRVAVGLPDVKVQEGLITSLSECGVRELIFFPAARSQAGESRGSKMSPRWDRLRIEAARQCERGALLEIRMSSFEEVVSTPGAIFLDEDPEAPHASESLLLNEAFVILGPEGGWTAAERESARDRGLQFLHWKMPILRVETAAIAASLWCYEHLNITK